MLSRTLCIAGALASGPAVAFAAGPVDFRIEPQPLSQALIAFASQADISIEASAAKNCGRTRGLRGRVEVAAGLRRLLAGTGCGFRLVDARTVIIVAAPAPPGAPSMASSSPQARQSAEVEEVIVTSPKRSMALSRAPYAVSVVSNADVTEGLPTLDAQGLATRVAGMTVTNLGAGRDKVFLRGMSDGPLTGRTQSVVGIYLDDARIIYNAPDPDLRLTDIDRVEVLRGPQGSLYGAGSMGGVMQIFTRRVDLDRFGGFVSAAASATSGGAPSSVVEGAVNVPVMPGALGMRLTGYSERIGGFIDDPGQDLKNLGGVSRQGVRVSARYAPTDRLNVRVAYVDQRIRSSDSQYSEGQEGSYSRYLQLREPYGNDFDGLTAAADLDFGWARLKIASSAQWHDVHALNDATLSLPLFSARAEGPGSAADINRIAAQVNEITLSSAQDRRLTWLAGVFASEHGQHLDTEVRDAAQSSLYREHRRDDIDEHAVYGEATLALNHRARLTLGGRIYHLTSSIRSTVNQAGQTERSFEGKTSDHGIAPKGVFEYDLTENVLAYAAATVGYRAGGFNTSGLTGQVFNVPGLGPQPYRRFVGDELTNYEAGVSARFLDGRLKLRAAAYSEIWQDIQADRLLPSGLPFTANVGDAHNRGLELEAAWRSGPISLNGEFLFNHPELSRPDPGFPTPVERGLPGVPDLIVNTSARHEWTVGPDRSVWVAADLGYVGRSKLTFDANLAPAMGGYFTSGLKAGISAGDWQALAYLGNPLRQKGDTFAFGNPYRIRFRDEHTPQRPINFGVTVTRGF